MHAKSLILYIFLSPLSLYSAAQPPVKTIIELPVGELPAYGFYTFEGKAVSQRLGEVQVTFDWDGRYEGHDFVCFPDVEFLEPKESCYVRGVVNSAFAIKLFKFAELKSPSYSFKSVFKEWRAAFENSDLAKVARMIDRRKKFVASMQKSSSSCIIL